MITSRYLSGGDMAAVMAIVNRTPDSFYDKGATHSFEDAVARVRSVLEDGATIVDIGGVKAGPGQEVSPVEEIDRVVPLIQAVHEAFPEAWISVDTWRAGVAEPAIVAGARIVNDTWAGHDPQLIEVAGQYKVGYVCSHTGGQIPRTRPFRVHYDDVVADVIAETTRLAEQAVSLGVPEDMILIDPTHDFGKNTYHSLELLRRIDEIVATGWPVLMALSNKDFVGEALDRPLRERVSGTLAATAWSTAKGVAAFRAHEVKETVDVIRMIAAIEGRRPPAVAVRGLA